MAGGIILDLRPILSISPLAFSCRTLIAASQLNRRDVSAETWEPPSALLDQLRKLRPFQGEVVHQALVVQAIFCR